MASEIAGTLAAIREKQINKTRKGCLYSPEELAVLSQYKDEYRSKTTPEERDQCLKGKVLVHIFNYWYEQEGVMPSEEETTKRVKVIIIFASQREEAI